MTTQSANTPAPEEEGHISFAHGALVVLIGSAAFLLYDMYIPALPAIAKSLDASAHLVQWSLTIYLLALSISQLVLGPLADLLGRRWVLLGGMFIVIVGLVIAALAENVWMFLAARAVQGIGTGANIALAKAIIRDNLVGAPLARFSSILGIAISLVTAGSVVLGGYLVVWAGWTSIFWTMAGVFVVLEILALVFMKGWAPRDAPRWSNRQERRAEREAQGIPSPFRQLPLLLVNRRFLSIMFVSSAIFGGLFAYLAVTPFLFHHDYKVDPTIFAWLTVIIVATAMAGKLLVSTLLGRLGLDGSHLLGVAFIVVGSVALLILVLFQMQNVWAIVIPFALYNCGRGIVMPVLTAKALSSISKQQAGAASGLYGTAQTGGAVVTTWIISMLPPDTALPLGIMLAIIAVLSVTLWFPARTPETTTART